MAETPLTAREAMLLERYGITRESALLDATRHSRAHSWNKHLAPYPGTPFALFWARGEQPRNHIEPSVSDLFGWHIWIVQDWMPTGRIIPNTWTIIHLTKEFEGWPDQPMERIEKERQRMMKEMVNLAMNHCEVDEQELCHSALLNKEDEDYARIVRELEKPNGFRFVNMCECVLM